MSQTIHAIALCENFRSAHHLWCHLRHVEGVQLEILICKNNARQHPILYLARLVGGFFLRLRLRDYFLTAKLLSTGKIHITTHPLHSPRVLTWLRQRSPDVGLHDMGVIYRKTIIDSFRLGILNPHIGLLPEYRGRSVMEWSLLHESPTGITTFFIDEGIDTGPCMVVREAVEVSHCETVEAAKQYLFSLNGEMFAKALKLLQQADFACHVQTPEEGTRYYVMSTLFTDIVSQLFHPHFVKAR